MEVEILSCGNTCQSGASTNSAAAAVKVMAIWVSRDLTFEACPLLQSMHVSRRHSCPCFVCWREREAIGWVEFQRGGEGGLHSIFGGGRRRIRTECCFLRIDSKVGLVSRRQKDAKTLPRLDHIFSNRHIFRCDLSPHEIYKRQYTTSDIGMPKKSSKLSRCIKVYMSEPSMNFVSVQIAVLLCLTIDLRFIPTSRI